MDAFATALNDLLVNTFHSILRLQEQSLKRISAPGLTLAELHMLEAIGHGKGASRNITDLARELSITLPSVTTAVNKLVRKGYVEKTKCQDDKRVVRVQLSPEGRRAEAAHRLFHRHMALTVSQGIKPEEKDVLLRGLGRLNAFFQEQELGLEQLLPQIASESEKEQAE